MKYPSKKLIALAVSVVALIAAPMFLASYFSRSFFPSPALPEPTLPEVARYRDSSLPADVRATDLLARMTLDEKRRENRTDGAGGKGQP